MLSLMSSHTKNKVQKKMKKLITFNKHRTADTQLLPLNNP